MIDLSFEETPEFPVPVLANEDADVLLGYYSKNAIGVKRRPYVVFQDRMVHTAVFKLAYDASELMGSPKQTPVAREAGKTHWL